MNIEDIFQNGIVGAGGAGFPAHIKLRAKPEILIMNAAECEPLLHKDIQLLWHHSDEVLKGFRVAMKICGASKGIIGIKNKHKKVIDLLSNKIEDNIQIEAVGDFYPAGDELTLVYLTTKRLVQPGKLPISVGCLVHNVETLFNIGSGRPVVDKYLTVAGAVQEPLTIKAPVGTSYKEILSSFNLTTDNFGIRCGGLMMGTIENDPDRVINKYTNGLIILPADHHCMVMYRRYENISNTVRIAKASCDQCTFCTDLCPRYLMGYPVRPETSMRNIMFGNDQNPMVHAGSTFCCECNLCTMYSCPESLDPCGATVMEKKINQKKKNIWEGFPVQIHPMMEYRKVPTKKLMQRLDLLQFRDRGPLKDIKIEPEQVRIPLKQHAGSAAKPVIIIGETVKKYQLIAKAHGEISANIHASINGKIKDINVNEIIIENG
jgi:Na+-translocating ferredoxin:NAD+ oxidoreductase RnfC subunit